MLTEPQEFSLSNESLDFSLLSQGGRLRLDRFGLAGKPPSTALPSSELYSVIVNGERFTPLSMQFSGGEFHSSGKGITHFSAHFNGPGFEVVQHIQVYAGAALVETWPVVHNTGPKSCKVSRVDSFSIDLPATEYELLSFTSDWGQEFQPVQRALTGRTFLETRLGRSSKGVHPWFALSGQTGVVLSGSVAWSGNWKLRFEPLEGGGWRLSGGLNEWEFEKDLAPASIIEFPHCILALGENLNAVSQHYAAVGRRFWYPHNDLSTALPVEWNHWWIYKDLEISDAAFFYNIPAAAEMGLELCTLDAGWFGPDEARAHWYDYRGDWQNINRQRFPHGLRPLSDDVHARGLRFGLWCEIEGLGKKAQLALDHPDFVARRDGEPLGYVCLGNPAARAWAFETLTGLIEQYNCDWIKLDFNMDPGAGCNCTDHGHGPGDGLYEHYLGYYGVLDRLRAAYPQVELEACSSGGLRIDLGLARRTHVAFLSDPDWPVHSLQIFWGASLMLAPNALLHWSFSQWPGEGHPPQQNFDPHDPALTPRRLDYYTRIAMLGQMGFSQKLPDLPPWVSGRLAEHVRIYKEVVRPFVRAGDLYRLTDQPRRDGQGERWCAFQYSLRDEDRHLLFVFCLPGAEKSRTLYPLALNPDRLYTVTDVGDQSHRDRLGRDLLSSGLYFDSLEEEDSALLEIK
jgi:alpha-galactosidase